MFIVLQLLIPFPSTIFSLNTECHVWDLAPSSTVFIHVQLSILDFIVNLIALSHMYEFLTDPDNENLTRTATVRVCLDSELTPGCYSQDNAAEKILNETLIQLKPPPKEVSSPRSTPPSRHSFCKIFLPRKMTFPHIV